MGFTVYKGLGCGVQGFGFEVQGFCAVEGLVGLGFRSSQDRQHTGVHLFRSLLLMVQCLRLDMCSRFYNTRRVCKYSYL